ncbi:MAG TPA: beta-galactosidase [Streptosporangiaceae bacterium]|nr:beta-galactosidase [Streptosporangiaceae bacterium]
MRGAHLPRRAVLSGAITLAAAGTIAGRPELATAATRPLVPGRRAAGHTIAFDKYSLIIDGRRLFIWSGEFHPFRLPSPPLWRDILQKMKASGYNAVCMYFSWNYHSAAPGHYDFSGVRDMDLVLDMAAETGLYVLVRPGPYINGEVNGGGFPGWLAATPGLARSDDPTYLGYADEWLTAINAVLARHQLTDGRGTVLLYQIENEYANFIGSPTGINYMAHLYAKARTDGITVPIYHNDKGRHGFWIPGSFPGSESDYLYAFDGYPSASGSPPDWGYFGVGGATGGSTASPATPGFEAEFGGGFFDPWGGAPWHGQGYAFERAFDGPVYERTFYLTNVANGIKIHNVYMTFGGTSWGWLPAPVVYTSYDYGAAISEARQLTAKIPAMKQMGYFLSSVGDVAMLDPAAAPAPPDPAVKAYHLTNPATGSHFFFLRNDHTADLTFTVPVATADGTYTVPLELNGKDMKVVVAAYQAESQHLVYTTSHLMTHAPMATDLMVLAGHPGEGGETVLRYPAEPQLTVVQGNGPAVAWDAATGDLRLDYTHDGRTDVLITPPAGPALLLLIVDDTAAAALWRLDSDAGPVLVYGPALVRTATTRGMVLALTGDTAGPAPLEVWAATRVKVLTWNGRPVPVSATGTGSVAARLPLPGPPAVSLPALGPWRYAAENPEAEPGFDDSSWTVANKTSSSSVTPVPAGQPVLFADDYGFHYGDVWYRGSWADDAAVTSVSLTYSTGQEGMLLAWLDGQFLGSHQMPVPTTAQATTQGWTAAVTLPLPASAQSGNPGKHVLAVLVRPMAHQEDGGVNNAFKTALGLTAVAFAGAAPAVNWRIQGSLGGEHAADAVRGPLNAGGLFGERNGWSLPGYPDRSWATVTLPHADGRPGVAWYRTRFRLAVPDGVDASLGLTITDDPSKAYRALIFVNGWNLGQYINGVGPQTTFVLPTGILDPRGDNTLAIAVTSGGLPGGGTNTAGTVNGGLGTVTLASLGTVAGGVNTDAYDN